MRQSVLSVLNNEQREKRASRKAVEQSSCTSNILMPLDSVDESSGYKLYKFNLLE